MLKRGRVILELTFRSVHVSIIGNLDNKIFNWIVVAKSKLKCIQGGKLKMEKMTKENVDSFVRTLFKGPPERWSKGWKECKVKKSLFILKGNLITYAFMEYNGTDLLDKNGNTHDIEDNCRKKVSEYNKQQEP